MLSWSISLFILAVLAAVLAFGGMAGTATGTAKLLFAGFVCLFVALVAIGSVRGYRRNRTTHTSGANYSSTRRKP